MNPPPNLTEFDYNQPEFTANNSYGGITEYNFGQAEYPSEYRPQAQQQQGDLEQELGQFDKGMKRSASYAGVQDLDDDDDPKKTGRRKIKIEYIEDKSRRHITFSKRKAGIMKKAYELSTLTGTQVLLLVASETGHVYTFATPKLQPLITKPEGKGLIQQCLNAGGSRPGTPLGFQSGAYQTPAQSPVIQRPISAMSNMSLPIQSPQLQRSFPDENDRYMERIPYQSQMPQGYNSLYQSASGYQFPPSQQFSGQFPSRYSSPDLQPVRVPTTVLMNEIKQEPGQQAQE